jgi:hypothetical protein
LLSHILDNDLSPTVSSNLVHLLDEGAERLSQILEWHLSCVTYDSGSVQAYEILGWRLERLVELVQHGVQCRQSKLRIALGQRAKQIG